MGQEVSATSVIMHPEHYRLTADGEVDWEELREKARQFKPRIIWSGGTAYTKIFAWEKYREIADETGAYFVADISHIGGLVAGGVHPSPVPWADVVMTTTHKSLRGPRGAMIMVTARGTEKDPELIKKIDKGVFPGVQGGPHMETVAALAVALEEAARPEFAEYAKQVVANAKTLAEELKTAGFKLVGNGTENHMVWMDLTDKGIDGWTAAAALEAAGLVTNRQAIPGDSRPAYYPSGLRLGTPAVTTRGMKETEMKKVAELIGLGIGAAKRESGGIGNAGGETADKAADQAARKAYKQKISNDPELVKIAGQVRELAQKFPVPE